MVDAVKMNAGLRTSKSWSFNGEQLQEAPGLNYQGAKGAPARASLQLGASDPSQLQLLQHIQQLQQLLGPADFSQLQTLPQLQQLQALQLLTEQQQLLQSQASCMPALQPHLYNSLSADSFLLGRDNQSMGCSLPMSALLPFGTMPVNDSSALFSGLPWQLMGASGASASQSFDLMASEGLPAALASLSFGPQTNSDSSSTTDLSLTGSPMGDSTDMLSFGPLPGSLPHIHKTLSDLTEAVGSPIAAVAAAAAAGANNSNSPSLEQQQPTASAAGLLASRLSQSGAATDYASCSDPPGLQASLPLSAAMCLGQPGVRSDVGGLMGGGAGAQGWDGAGLKCMSAGDEISMMGGMI